MSRAARDTSEKKLVARSEKRQNEVVAPWEFPELNK